MIIAQWTTANRGGTFWITKNDCCILMDSVGKKVSAPFMGEYILRQRRDDYKSQQTTFRLEFVMEN